ncbi:MAG: glycosyltransferase [Clostridiaceae bacterium]|jgi:glycosyltransferase involved in cell wall biosynthesis|nr:glycosyltransferase [Clostridiaceae bacterium]
MIKVLHLINYLGSGGTEKYISSLAAKLHNKSCRFYVAYSTEGNGVKAFEEAGVDLLRLEMKGPFDIGAARKLKKICTQYSIEVIHTHFLRENYIAILSKILGNHVKIINTRHMLLENSKAVIAANSFFTRYNDNIIAVSKKVKDQLLEERIQPDKIKLIHNGIDPEDWNTTMQPTFRKEAGISDDDIVITSVARFSPEKGHEFLLEGIRTFKDMLEGSSIVPAKARFVLVGDGELHGQIIEKARALGLHEDILFTGYQEDIGTILKSSDIFISHSSSEAFGISILEAMASGLPVISTDSGGTAEIVNGFRKSGILIAYGDKDALATSLIRLIQDRKLMDEYIRNGYQNVREHFSLDKTSEETYNLYAGLL